jgi:predicted RNA-binding protein
MCLATAYIESEDHKEEVMRDVAWIETESQGVLMISFLGERHVSHASIKSVDLVHGTIILEGDKDAGDERAG